MILKGSKLFLIKILKGSPNKLIDLKPYLIFNSSEIQLFTDLSKINNISISNLFKKLVFQLFLAEIVAHITVLDQQIILHIIHRHHLIIYLRNVFQKSIDVYILLAQLFHHLVKYHVIL
jgi:hypothetical protein